MSNNPDMMLYIGLDDTDIVGTRGTGQLARIIAADLTADYVVVGIVRHQLLFDSRIPYTAKNSSASILVNADSAALDGLFEHVRHLLLSHFQAGSDPGLAIAAEVPEAVIQFGQRAKREILSQSIALSVAEAHGIRLLGLGGTNDGIIGALASVGLAASGNDGRYIQVGTIRDLEGLQSVASVHAAGIEHIQTLNRDVITAGSILADNLRPARRDQRPVLFVEAADDYWQPLKLD